MWGGISGLFWCAFPWWLRMMNIFSGAFQPFSGIPQLRILCLALNPIFNGVIWISHSVFLLYLLLSSQTNSFMRHISTVPLNFKSLLHIFVVYVCVCVCVCVCTLLITILLPIYSWLRLPTGMWWTYQGHSLKANLLSSQLFYKGYPFSSLQINISASALPNPTLLDSVAQNLL